MTYSIVSQQIITLLIVLIIGYIAKKTKLIDDNATKKLATLLMYVTQPALIFNSFISVYDPSKIHIMYYVATGSIACFIISIFLAEKLFFSFIKKDIKELSVLKASSVFSNSGYMGIPLINELYGTDGVFYVSIYIVIFQISIWTYGVTLYSGKKDWHNLKKVLVSPALISVAIGLFTYVLQIPVHKSLIDSSHMVGVMTTPIAMMIIGSNLFGINFKEIISGWKVYYISLIRLLLVPSLSLIAFYYIAIPAMASKIIITALAMPVAINVAVFAEKFGADSIFASKVITVTTILSMLTIPLVLSFL